MIHRYTLSIALLLFVASAARAQSPNGWDSLDLGQRSGFLDDRESIGNVYFRDSLNGWVTASSQSYATTDGGVTWSVAIAPPQRPTGVMVDSLFGYSGWSITTDGGVTWSRVTFATDDPVLASSIPLTLVAANPRHLVVMLHNGYRAFDSIFGFERSHAILRPAHSTDGGATWKAIDSVRVRYVGGRPQLDIGLVLGDTLPSPWPHAQTRYGWSALVDMPDSTHVRAIIMAQALDPAVLTNRFQYYLGTLDLVDRSAVWSPMPGWHNEEYSGNIGYLRLSADRHTLIIADSDVTNNGLNDRAMWLSSDGGATWDSIRQPPTLQMSDLRSFPGGLVVARNGRSTDNGLTWQMRDHPWYDANGRFGALLDPSFDAPDPEHLYLGNRGGLFARSSDGGLTWTRNAAGGQPQTIVARDGHVVVGRTYQSVLSTSDAGLTWYDAYDDRALPENLHSIVALAHADVTSGTDRLVGIGRFIARDGRRYSAMLRSSDGGRSWTRGAEVSDSLFGEMFAFPRASSEHLVVAGYSGGVRVSSDGGETWTHTVRDYVHSIVMSDADNGVGYFGQLKLATTTDGGRTWQSAGGNVTGPIEGLAVDILAANDYRAIGAAGTGKLVSLRSTDRGATWQITHRADAPAMRTPRGTYAFWIDSARVYVGSGGTSPLYYSRDAGRTFDRVPVPFFHYVMARDDRYLYLVNAGNGAARIDLAAHPARVEMLGASALALRLEGDRMTLSGIDVRDAELEIFDARGAVRHRSTITAPHSSIDVAALSSGHYLVRLTSGTTVRLGSFVITR